MVTEMLRQISAKQDMKLYEEFLEKATSYKEQSLLVECAKSALQGRDYISFGRNCIVPRELQKEGFYIESEGSVYNLTWK